MPQPDKAVLALCQTMLGGSSAQEEAFMINELCRRLILNGMQVTAGGVISLGPFSFTPSSPWTIANGGTNSGTALSGSSIMISNGTQIVQGTLGTTTTVLHGNAAGAPAYSAVVEGDLSTSDLTTADVTSTKHGFAPKAPADATKFLNGAATPAYANPLNPVQTDILFTDATNDIGKTGATRPRDGFFSRNLNVQGSITQATVALADGATPALDASLGNTFRLPAAGDRTIAVPTNPVSGQKIVIIHFASGGARTLALNSGAGGFRFGSDITSLTQTASGKSDYIGCIYNSTDSKWDVVAVTKGF